MATGGGLSKQKSCNACVRSKRRCDKRTPACSNCTKKRYLCVYGSRLQMNSSANSADVPRSVDSFGDSLSTHCDSLMLDDGGSSADFDVNLGLSPSTILQIDSAFDSLLNSTFETAYDQTPGQTEFLRQGINIASSTSTSKILSLQDYSKLLPMCEDYAPWQLADPSSTVAYGMSVYKNFHVSFCRDNSTIYMHRNLYASDPPRWILQAFSVCVLYTNQTPATRGYVLRVLHEHVTSLVETASGTAFTPRDKLARVHAMIVYQTIRMFDGDISLSQQAQDDIPLLEAWTNELGKIKDNLEDLVDADASEIRSKPPESWERWVFAESVRRTYIISSALKAFWEVLKGQRTPIERGTWQYVHRWTLSSYLWNATDPLDFFKAWKEKPMWIISAFHLDEFLRTGTRDDVDDFGLVFLTLSFGVNEMKMFSYETSKRLST
ncbi:hypothetical protein F4820DRAFT_46693 [Hypoxylon rubiginosum]|uniref:Uncharacterized protein n=1 Tax=Hypoxylon rubiginosum TaxID=110542 RepID=A0ACB9ZBY9_9PEZI|nr:hypothetical protein F4820DRAFT_46693 [Hypoxylon rubiginosum]